MGQVDAKGSAVGPRKKWQITSSDSLSLYHSLSLSSYLPVRPGADPDLRRPCEPVGDPGNAVDAVRVAPPEAAPALFWVGRWRSRRRRRLRRRRQWLFVLVVAGRGARRLCRASTSPRDRRSSTGSSDGDRRSSTGSSDGERSACPQAGRVRRLHLAFAFFVSFRRPSL